MWGSNPSVSDMVWLLPVGVIAATAYALFALVLFQKSGYNASFFKKAYRGAFKFDCLCFCGISVLACFLFCLGMGGKVYLAALAFLQTAIGVIHIFLPQKTSKHFTPRLLRLTALTALVFTVELTALFVFSVVCLSPFLSPLGFSAFAFFFFGLLFLSPTVTVCAAARIALPIEDEIARGFLERAQKKLFSSPETVRVGITGSYGKTTVKHMLAAILSVKYRVLFTPASFNTPLGVAKCINQSKETPQVFLAEMGAKHQGDISALCRFIRPEIGVLTVIGNQHLQTFRTQEVLRNEKEALCRFVEKTDGTMIFGADESLTPLVRRFRGKRYVAGESVSTELVKEDASGITVRLQKGEDCAELALPLYGRHAVENLSLAIAAAQPFSLTFSELVQGISRVQSAPHRLQVLSLSDCTVIDDSYNGNPNGAKEALRVMGLFSGRKVVVTPGLVELGALSYDENCALGKEIAAVADVTVIVAKENERALSAGLAQANYAGTLFRFSNRVPLQKIVKTVKRKGDVILFLNDLPDTYR